MQASGRKWVVVTNTEDQPLLVVDADGLLREALFSTQPPDPYRFCHRPLVVTDAATPIGSVVRKLWGEPSSEEDDVIDCDVILVWDGERRIITGADLLGRLMRGIVERRRVSRAERAMLWRSSS